MTNIFNEKLKELKDDIKGFMYTYGHFLNTNQYDIFSNFEKEISKEFNI